MPLPHRLRFLLDGLVDLIYPRGCPGCEQRLPDDATWICPSCLQALRPVPRPAVRARLTGEAGSDEAIDWAAAAWWYEPDTPLRGVLHQLKYLNRRELGVPLGELLAEAIGEELIRFDPDPLLLPIPLGRVRYLERGYNQSTLIADGMARRGLGTVDISVLSRSRETRPQTELPGGDRSANVAGAFTVLHRDSRTDRTVVLVDDVCTTGSTLRAVVRVLAEAGLGPIGVVVCGLARLRAEPGLDRETAVRRDFTP